MSAAQNVLKQSLLVSSYRRLTRRHSLDSYYRMIKSQGVSKVQNGTADVQVYWRSGSVQAPHSWWQYFRKGIFLIASDDKSSKPGPKPGAAIRRRRDKRQEIIDSAARLMRAHGYNGVSLRALASEMNLTEPALYYYVTSKEELLYAILNRGIERAVELLETFDPQDAPVSVQLKRIMFSFTKGILEDVDAFTVYFQDKNKLSAEYQANLTAKERRFVHLVAGVIQQGIENGDCRADAHPVVTALTLIGASAWTYKWYGPEGPLTQEQVSEQIATTCIESCLTEQGRQSLLILGVAHEQER